MSRLSTDRIRRLQPALPARPEIVARVLELSGRDDTSMSALATVVAQDPAIAARVLRLANSSLYGFPYRVATIDHAVVLLGMASVRDVVIASAVIHRFGDADCPIDIDNFWRHSLAVGVVSRILASGRGGQEPERMFLHGLLHDTGKLILAVGAPEEYARAQEAYDSGQPILKAETKYIGVDHAAAGAILFERWSLPSSFGEVARWHHEPSLASAERYGSAVVHVADALARAALLGDESWVGPVPQVDSATLELLGIEDQTLPLVVEEASGAIVDAISVLGLTDDEAGAHNDRQAANG